MYELTHLQKQLPLLLTLSHILSYVICFFKYDQGSFLPHCKVCQCRLLLGIIIMRKKQKRIHNHHKK